MDIKISSLVAAMVNKAGQNIILTISLLYQIWQTTASPC
jgi:hypothetical protein